MARQTTAVAPKQMAVGRRVGKTYPSVPIERLPPPPDQHALRMRGVQITLWRRLRPPLWFLGIGTTAFAGLITLATTTDIDTGFPSAAFGITLVTWLFTTPIGLVGALRVGLIALHLRGNAWKAYDVVHFQMPAERPITMTLVDGAKRYPIRFANGKRAETLRGMIRPQVWFIGDPARRGIMTPAGGHELLWVRPNPTPQTVTRPVRQRAKPATPAKPMKPAKLKPLKPVDPETARKHAAKAKERMEKDRQRAAKERELAAKVAARHQAWLEKHPPKPPKQAKPPRLPNMRGAQKIKWK